MSEHIKASDGEQRRKKWLMRLADEFEKVEKMLPANFVPKASNCPPWVERVERELSLVLLPAANLRDANYVITPKRMGAVIGHGCAMAVWMMEWFNSESQKPVGVEVSEDDLKKGEGLNQTLLLWYQAACRLAKLSLCACVDQTYEDMRDFLLGYADGFSRKPTGTKASEMGSATFEIYLFMIFHQPLIERLDSVRQFHATLTQTFGPRVGDLKRVEKICQRIGVSFRKPGRPKKV